MENTKKQIENYEYLFPLNNIVKVVDTKKGRRFYQGSRAADRFFPLSKKNFEKLDLKKVQIFEEIAGIWFRIN